MRRIVCLAVVVALAAAGAARAEEKAGPKALIDKAIKAAGGEAKLAGAKAEVMKGKGKFYGMGEGIDYTGEWTLELPHKMHVRIESDAGGMKFTFVRVVNGDKVWMKLGDDTQAVEGKDEIDEAKDELYADWVATLVPLVKEKGFELAPLGEVKVNGKAAEGVRVSHKGHKDVNLFFDKDTGLLIKTEAVVKDPMAGGKEVTQETLYSDFKEMGGVKHATNIVINRDGKKYVTLEVSSIEPKEKVDDALFGKP